MSMSISVMNAMEASAHECSMTLNLAKEGVVATKLICLVAWSVSQVACCKG